MYCATTVLNNTQKKRCDPDVLRIIKPSENTHVQLSSCEKKKKVFFKMLILIGQRWLFFFFLFQFCVHISYSAKCPVSHSTRCFTQSVSAYKGGGGRSPSSEKSTSCSLSSRTTRQVSLSQCTSMPNKKQKKTQTAYNQYLRIRGLFNSTQEAWLKKKNQ